MRGSAPLGEAKTGRAIGCPPAPGHQLLRKLQPRSSSREVRTSWYQLFLWPILVGEPSQPKKGWEKGHLAGGDLV